MQLQLVIRFRTCVLYQYAFENVVRFAHRHVTHVGLPVTMFETREACWLTVVIAIDPETEAWHINPYGISIQEFSRHSGSPETVCTHLNGPNGS